MDFDTRWFETVLKKHRKDGSIVRVLSLEMKPAVGKGENFSSEMLRIKMRVVMGSGQISQKSLIFKKHPEFKPKQEYLIEYHAYPIEIIMYSQILPEMERLMEENGDKSDKLWCDIYSFRTNDYMILEDLQESGFNNVDRTELMDLDHMKFTMRNIARFHAMSAILINRKRLDPNMLKPYCMARNVDKMNQLMSTGMRMLHRVMKETWGPEWNEAANKILELSKDIGWKMEELMKNNSGALFVLNHGDCWINNIMFRHELGTNIPTAIRFVDLQESHFNSFGWDLVFIMRTGVKRDDWEIHSESILQAYLDSLKATFTFYDWYPPGGVPSLKDVLGELNRLFVYGLVLSTVAIPFFMADSQDSLEIDDLINENDPQSMAKKRRMYLGKEYEKLVKRDIKSFMNNSI